MNKDIKLNVEVSKPRDFSNRNPGYDVCFGKEAWAVEVALKRELVEALKELLPAACDHMTSRHEEQFRKRFDALITRAEATLL